MSREYVEMRYGGYYVAGTRISLDSIVCLYQEGASPEAIQDDFPSLSLEQIHGSTAFYLAYKNTVDKIIADGNREFEKLVTPLEIANPDLHARLSRARHELKR